MVVDGASKTDNPIRIRGLASSRNYLAYVLVALYAVALGRAGELLGARDQGWLKACSRYGAWTNGARSIRFTPPFAEASPAVLYLKRVGR